MSEVFCKLAIYLQSFKKTKRSLNNIIRLGVLLQCMRMCLHNRRFGAAIATYISNSIAGATA